MTNERTEKQVLIMGIISLAVLCLALAIQASAQDQGTAREVFKGSVELRDRTANMASSIDGYGSERMCDVVIDRGEIHALVVLECRHRVAV